jgi:hypothetical protein
MTPLTIQVPARELRVGDHAKVEGAAAGIVSAIREFGQFLRVYIGGQSLVLSREERVEIRLEDDGL